MIFILDHYDNSNNVTTVWIFLPNLKLLYGRLSYAKNTQLIFALLGIELVNVRSEGLGQVTGEGGTPN